MKCNTFFMRFLYTQNKYYILLFGLVFNLNVLSGQSLYINEFMAGNTMIPDEFGEFDDWIELYNGGTTPIDINGYFLSDDIANPLFFQIDTSVIIEPGGFVLLWADKDTEQGKFHLDFKLSAVGEQISVMSSFGEFTDSLTYGQQIDDVSTGRAPDGSNDFFIFTEPTPGVSNSTSGSIGTAANPEYNLEGGFYNNAILLELSSSTPGAMIYYTLDGSDPEESSILYSSPIMINASTVVRSKTFATNFLSSDIVGNEYLINENYTLPVLSIITDPDNMFGTSGIYSNPAESGSAWERPCQIQYLKDDTLGFSLDCGIRIQGSSSILNPKKSFRLYFDEDYGPNRLEYPLFENNDVTDFKNLVLRAGSDDDISMLNGSLLKDPFGNRAYQNSGGLVSDGNWAILKINGAYWGIYEVRESLNDKFIESHTGWNNFDLIRFEETAPDLKAGTLTDWNFLRNFLETTDFTIEANYLQATELIDIDNLINLLAFTQVSSFSTWSTGVYTYKRSTVGSKWKYTVWDLEENHTDENWNAHDDYGTNTATTWANFFNAALTPNETFRNKLVNRTADLLNSSYLPGEASAFLNGIKNEIEAEIGGEYDRWNSSMDINDWNTNIDNVHTFLNNRPNLTRDFILNHYGFIDVNSVNLDVVGSGTIKMNTLDIATFPWSGIYFENVPVPITAIAGPGHVFSGWSDPSLPNNPSVEVSWADTYNLTAFFTPGSTQIADVIINEINYNSAVGSDAGDWVELYNASGVPVDLSRWYFKDQGDDYFSIPDNTVLPIGGYLVLVEDSLLFQTVYPGTTNFIGNFDGFKLSNNGEFIALSNADASYRDTVSYDDGSPWPIEPDGTGPTLQLRAPDLDNALASSWSTFDPTPGFQNTQPANQTIDFQNIADKFTTDVPFMITATASSGLAVTYSIISGPASISGNTITLDGVGGTVGVRAFQAGDNFYFSEQEDQFFEVFLQNQTISFSSLPNKITTDAPFTISAVATSGLPVAFSIISGPASISGNTITLDGTGGTVTVRAAQGGSDDYNPATDIEQSFEVLLQNQTIDFSTLADKLTTDVPFLISASASSGLAVDFSIISGPASISGNTITLDGTGGTVIVRATQSGNGTYNPATDVDQSFEVLLQNQTIDFSNIPDKITTDLPFMISAIASSGLAVDLSIISGPAILSGNTITLDGTEGTVVVQASQSGNNDYNPAMTVEQSFEVTILLNQTIDFTPIPNKFTIDNPFDISAIASSSLPVSLTLISGPASLSGNTITLDGVTGTVVLQASQGGDDDYNPAMTVEQSFEVLLQDQTIDFEMIADKLTVDMPFDITATVSSGLDITYQIVSGPASVSGNTITLDGVGGTVLVSASQSGDDEYNPAMTLEQSFEVLLQDQTIDFSMITDKFTNDPDFEIIATATSDLEVSFNILSGPAVATGNMISLNGTPGTVTVEAIQEGDNDFNPAISVEQSFEVLLFNTTTTLEDETLFVVYPNPVGDRLHLLDDSERSGTYEVMVHNVYGRMMGEELLNFGANQVQVIDVKDFASGLYTITLSKEGRSVTMRFVKQ